MTQSPTVENPFTRAASGAENAIAEATVQREIAEVQAAMIVAKRFPRDQLGATDRILNACTRPGLAESALYEYAKGGTNITGPSIRLAEALAQNWGNMQFGIRELDQRDDESTVEAYAWDVETNTRQAKVFHVPHIRHTRKGAYKLDDPREIYELVANQGARRLRACILGVIPGDVIDAAVRQCEITMATKADCSPDRVKSMVDKFAKFGVSVQQIEARIQRRIDAITPAAMVNLGKVYNSLRDGMSAASDWFGDTASQSQSQTRLRDQVRKKPEYDPVPLPVVEAELVEPIADVSPAPAARAKKGVTFSDIQTSAALIAETDAAPTVDALRQTGLRISEFLDGDTTRKTFRADLMSAYTVRYKALSGGGPKLPANTSPETATPAAAESPAPVFTFAEVAARLHRATTQDERDEACALIELVASEEQRTELTTMYDTLSAPPADAATTTRRQARIRAALDDGGEIL